MKCAKQLISDDKLRIVLENNICREDGPQYNCFCIPVAYAWTALSEVLNGFWYLVFFLLGKWICSFCHQKSSSIWSFC